MKRRKRLERYVGLDVSVCEGLQDFSDFLQVLGTKPTPDHSIDRIDNLKGYWCGNCSECQRLHRIINVRWATRKEQCRNTRRNRVITINGVSKSTAEWAEIAGLNKMGIIIRLNRGWPVDENLIRPPMKSEERSFANARNRSTNRLVTYEGITLCLAEWAERKGVKYSLLHQRINKYGWSFHEALTIPTRTTKATT